MYIDCHAHIFFSPIPPEAIDENITGEIPTPTMDFIGKMISNAKKKGVNHIVGVISNPKDFQSYRNQLEIDNIIHVIGISRGNALEDHSHLISLLDKEIKRKLPHAIGEIGLDYGFGFDGLTEDQKNSLKKKQQELFGKQIQLAKEYDIPIVVHAGYGTDKDIVKVLNQEHAQEVGGQIHGYMSKRESLTELIDSGFYISFGYYHTKEEELKKIVEMTPMEKILTETDSPYHLIESPKRFILPEDLVLVSGDIARLKEVGLEEFTNQINKNAKNLFKF